MNICKTNLYTTGRVIEIVFKVIITVAFAYLIAATLKIIVDKKITKAEDTIIKPEEPSFLNEAVNDSTLLLSLYHYNVKEPIIVLAQAKLESANYRSRLFIERNNLFGLYDSSSSQYYRFDHWTNCILAYKNKIEYKLRKGEDYYDFLSRIGYAQDEKYIDKVKTIVKQLEEKWIEKKLEIP